MAEKLLNGERHFYCNECSKYWLSAEYEILDPSNTDDKDFNNFSATCPSCGQDTFSCPHFYANLPKMSKNATGPKTAKGKERVSKNAITHGRYAGINNLLYPAKYIKDTACDSCENLEPCKEGNLKFCTQKTGLLLRYLTAYQSGGVSGLKEMAGLSQARLGLILENIFSDLQKHGVTLIAPKTTKSGEIIVDDKNKVINVYSANPLLQHLPNMISMLGFNAEQQLMTPAKTSEEGRLNNPGTNAALGKQILDAVIAFAQGGANIMAEAHNLRSQDKVYNELNGETISEDEIHIDYPESNPFPTAKKGS